MNSRLSIWLVEHRLALFMLSMIFIALTGFGTLRLVEKTDYKIFFNEDDPQLLATEHIKNVFSPSDSVLFLIHPTNDNIFTKDNLSAIEELTRESWMIPYSQRVDSLTNFQHTFVDGDDLQVEDLVQNAIQMNDQEINLRKNIALNEPLLLHRLISTTGHVSAINIQLSLPADQTQANPEVLEFVRELRDTFEQKHPDINVMITGVTPLNNAFAEMTDKDAKTLIPIMLLVILILSGIMLRSLSSTLVTLLIIVFSVVTALASMGWLNITINNVTAVSPIIILTLAVADCIHLLSHYLMALRQGRTQKEALTESLDINIRPIFLTSLTTAVGFLSMLTSESPPFRELGVVAALGVTYAFLFTLTVMPQLIMWLTTSAPKIDTERSTLFSGLADFTIKHPKILFFGSLSSALVCMSFIGMNVLNDDSFGYFSKNLEIRQASDFAENNLNGVNFLEYTLNSGKPNGISDPEYLSKVEAFVEWFRLQPKVTHVFSFTEILKRLHQNMNENNPDFYALPENRELASQYQLLYEMSLPFGMDLNNQISLDKSTLRITVSFAHAKSQDILNLDALAQEWFAENAPELQTFGASPSIMFATIGIKNILSMINGTVIATLIISAILILSLGSWKLGLLSIIPNAFPAAIMLGLWGFFVGEVNIAVAVVFGITLGIVVDYSVHFMSKYLRGYNKHNGDVEKAIHYAFEHVGAALLTTTLVLALGFGLLALSDFRVNAILGTMVSLTIVIALIFDFLFLPSMVLLLSKFLHPKNKAHIEPSQITKGITGEVV